MSNKPQSWGDYASTPQSMPGASKTPVSDKVRAMELSLNAMKSARTDVAALHSAVQDSEDTRYAIVHPALASNYQLNKNNYLALLSDHIDLLNADIDDLEHKLTTVYAAINECLGDSNDAN